MIFEKQQAQQRILQLRELLNRYSYQYYVENESEISDFEYDQMMRELETLEGSTRNFARRIPPRYASAAWRKVCLLR